MLPGPQRVEVGSKNIMGGKKIAATDGAFVAK
jgi:hypothetical protein